MSLLLSVELDNRFEGSKHNKAWIKALALGSHSIRESKDNVERLGLIP